MTEQEVAAPAARIHVLTVVPGLAKTGGGPSYSVTALSDGLAEIGMGCSIVTTATGHGKEEVTVRPLSQPEPRHGTLSTWRSQ
jgi:hypothetical protein